MNNIIICETITGDSVEIQKDKLIFRPAAYGLVINENNKVLLVNTKSSGKWFFPGGALEIGEKSIESLKRELYEETGSKVSNIELLLNKETFFYYKPLNKAYHTINLVYLAKLESQDIDFVNPDSEDEADGFSWIDIYNLKPEDMQSFAWEVISLTKEKMSS